ncbi:unnamed protein product [Camellia sinensis]
MEKTMLRNSKRSFWTRSVVGKTDGIELNLEGVKFRLTASIPESDDFGMRKEWEERNAFGYSRGGRQQLPDTIVLKGVPSRWFAEPRVSSKPSMLVTHTIFSAFGKISHIENFNPNNYEGLAEAPKAQFSCDYNDHLALVRAYEGWKEAERDVARYEYC